MGSQAGLLVESLAPASDPFEYPSLYLWVSLRCLAHTFGAINISSGISIPQQFI